MNHTIAQSLTLETLRTSTHPREYSAKPMHVWSGTHSAWCEFLRTYASDRVFSRALAKMADDSSFSGITVPRAQWLASGVFPNALEAFNAASARLHAENLQPGTLRPAVAGGAWVVPLVLAGNPMPSRIRERSKLPPKSIRVGVTVSGLRAWQGLADPLARLAHGAWEYLQAGGAITVEVWHCAHYDRAMPDGARGLVVKIKCPLTDKAAFASALSVQCKRGATLSLACAVAGSIQSLPMCYVDGLESLSADPARDAATLKKLGIT